MNGKSNVFFYSLMILSLLLAFSFVSAGSPPYIAPGSVVKLNETCETGGTGYNPGNGWSATLGGTFYSTANPNTGSGACQLSYTGAGASHIQTTTNMTTNMSCQAFMYYNETPNQPIGLIWGTSDEYDIGYVKGNTNVSYGDYISMRNSSVIWPGNGYVTVGFYDLDGTIGRMLFYANGTYVGNGSGYAAPLGTPKLWWGSQGGQLTTGTILVDDIVCVQGNYSAFIQTFIPITPQTNLSITAIKDYSGSIINNFTASINNTLLLNTTNGIINTNIPSNNTQLVNITIRSTQDGGYFNKTYTNYNTSVNVNASMIQSDIRFVAYDLITLNSVYGSYSVNGTTQNNSHFYPAVGVYNVTFYNTSFYYNQTSNFTIKALDNYTVSVNGIYSTIVNVTYKDTITSMILSDYTMLVYNDTNSYYKTYIVNNTHFLFNWSSVGFGINITKNGYVNLSANATPTGNASVYNLTINSFSTPSILVSTKDLLTQASINNTAVNITGIDTSYFATNATTNGISFFSNTSLGRYNIIVGSVGYTNSNYVAMVGSVNNVTYLTAYLLNQSLTNNCSLTIYDDKKTAIQGAFVSLSYIGQNGIAYQLFGGISDIAGQVNVPVNNQYNYLLLVSYPGLQTKSANFIPTSCPYNVFMTTTVISYLTSIPAYGIELGVVPSSRIYNAGGAYFNATALSSYGTLVSLKSSIKTTLGECLMGAYDGENCTSTSSGSPNTLTNSIKIDTTNYPNLVMNVYFNTTYGSQNMKYSFSMNQSDFNSMNYNQTLAPSKSLEVTTGYSGATLALIMFIIAIIIGVSLASFGLPGGVVMMVSIGLWCGLCWMMISTTGVNIIVTIVSALLFTLVMREGL